MNLIVGNCPIAVCTFENNAIAVGDLDLHAIDYAEAANGAYKSV